MLDDTTVVDGADSTTADPSATTSPATDAGQHPAEETLPFHQHPRWQERTREIQTLRQQNAQLNQQNAQINQRLQQLEQRREQTGAPPSDEERQLKDARDALYGKVAPELKDVGDVVQEFRQDRFVSGGERMIEGFAKEHGLNAVAISQNLAAIIKNDPQLMARAAKGDVSLVANLLGAIAPVVAAMKQQQTAAQRGTTAATAQTKTDMLRTVPPRPAGSQSGAVAPPKLAPDGSNAREHLEAMHKQGGQMLERLLNQ